MLSMLLAIWASRSSLFNEMLVGNDADYRRAFEAAQALLQDAELDIQGANSDGTSCTPNPTFPSVCRQKEDVDKIPLDDTDVADLLAKLGASASKTPRCSNGLCVKRANHSDIVDKQDFWNNSDKEAGITLQQMTGVGARFGEFTGARPGDDISPANPILRERGDNKGGWYWIEVMPYARGAGPGIAVGGANYLPLNLNPNVVYRITALAYGRKPHTMVVLQQTYVQQKFKN
ncbi:MAG: pilus assembly protein [Comamonadaceae bacterium]|nr:MAG: pilus assembly protein [Comamonadaceae bacterium]